MKQDKFYKSPPYLERGDKIIIYHPNGTSSKETVLSTKRNKYYTWNIQTSNLKLKDVPDSENFELWDTDNQIYLEVNAENVEVGDLLQAIYGNAKVTRIEKYKSGQDYVKFWLDTSLCSKIAPNNTFCQVGKDIRVINN